MKIILSAVSLAIIIIGTADAQIADTIQIRHPQSYWYHGVRIKSRDLLRLTADFPDVNKEVKLAQTNEGAANVFGFIGGFCVGYSIAATFGGGKFNGGLFAVGVASIGAAIPFSIAYGKHARHAIHGYNGQVKQRTASLDFKMQVAANGLTLKMRF